jgi:hypothetical protein
MSRRNLGSIHSHMFMPCGKDIMKSERDMSKYMKLHKKVCEVCREAVFVTSTTMALDDGLRITKNGGIEKIEKASDHAKQIEEVLQGMSNK